MSEMVLNDANFASEVLNAKGVYVVDFFATWCGPCKMIGPIIEEIAKEYEGKAKVGKVDVDGSPNTAGQFGVQSIPTIILFKDGKEIDRVIGFQGKDALKAKIDANL
ncbi:thioredoxin [Candidatus Peregrinibacteria bacterium]|nr:thioredoxin [Candidatus Peregrinibacteria bacterium]